MNKPIQPCIVCGETKRILGCQACAGCYQAKRRAGLLYTLPVGKIGRPKKNAVMREEKR